jgi:hypothetical protein
MFCCDLVLEKFRIFNKKVTEKEYDRIKNKIHQHLGLWKHPKQLTVKDMGWLRKNIKQYDQKVMDKIIQDSILPEKPKEQWGKVEA